MIDVPLALAFVIVAITAAAYVAFRLRNRNVATLESTTMTPIGPTPTSDSATSRETTAAP